VSSRNIGIALALNASFAVIELVGGLLTGSVAILADALHDFGDSLALGMALVLEKFAQKKQSANFSYGYKRLSLLSALLTSSILMVGSVVILANAIPRLFNPVQPKVEGMIGLAILGIAVNGYAAWKVMHGSTMNEKAISWHMMEDVFGWVVVLAGSVVMMFWDVPIIDPILSIIFTLVILAGVFKPFLATSRLFLQGAPKGLKLEHLQSSILAIEHVREVHDVHVWSLDGAAHVMTMHAVVDDNTSMLRAAEIKGQIRHLVAEQGAFHLTLEIETRSEGCPDTHRCDS
jgi:cobalt-zinc-cadmium efflux system protein